MTRCTLLLTSFFFALTAGAEVVLDRTVVTVNNDVILESDIEKFRGKIQSKSYQELFGGVDEKILGNRQSLINLMIEEKIINQQVKKLELEASDQEIDGQIRSIAKRNGITQAQLSERLKQLGTSIPEYKDAIKRQIERKNLIDREIKPSLEISDEQLRHFYTRNAGENETETQYKIAHILIEDKKKAGVSGEARAKQVWEEVNKNPAEFPKFVAQYTDDGATAEAAGLLGDFSTSALANEFKAEVPKTQVGKVTRPIKTRAGFHILKVLERKTGNFSALSKEKREMLRAQLISSELEKKMSMWLDRKRSESHIRVSENVSK